MEQQSDVSLDVLDAGVDLFGVYGGGGGGKAGEPGGANSDAECNDSCNTEKGCSFSNYFSNYPLSTSYCSRFKIGISKSEFPSVS